jgi:hypothetical protein
MYFHIRSMACGDCDCKLERAYVEPADIRLKRWSKRLYIPGTLDLLNPHNFLPVRMIA